MGLIQVDKKIITSAATSIALNGITTDDVYMIAINNFHSNQNNDEIYMRVNKSSSAQTDSNYDYVYRKISDAFNFSERSEISQDKAQIFENISSGGGNGIFYLYNFNSSSLISTVTIEAVMNISNQDLTNVGGFHHKVQSSSNGVTILGAGTTNLTGEFYLYQVTS